MKFVKKITTCLTVAQLSYSTGSIDRFRLPCALSSDGGRLQALLVLVTTPYSLVTASFSQNQSLRGNWRARAKHVATNSLVFFHMCDNGQERTKIKYIDKIRTFSQVSFKNEA